jgi:hypothetical protein
LMRSDIDIPVLSYQELAPEIAVLPVSSVSCGGHSDGTPSLHLVQGIGATPAN